MASRIEVLPIGTAAAGSGGSPRPSTIYFYIGLDCGDAITEDEESCLEAGEKSGAALVVVDSESSPRRSLLVRGAHHPRHGGFEMEAAVASTRDSGGLSSEGDGDLTFAFMGKRDAPIVDIKQEVERLHEAHRRTSRRAKKEEGFETGPFVLPNKVDVGSNVVLVQVR